MKTSKVDGISQSLGQYHGSRYPGIAGIVLSEVSPRGYVALPREEALRVGQAIWPGETVFVSGLPVNGQLLSRDPAKAILQALSLEQANESHSQEWGYWDAGARRGAGARLVRRFSGAEYRLVKAAASSCPSGPCGVRWELRRVEGPPRPFKRSAAAKAAWEAEGMGLIGWRALGSVLTDGTRVWECLKTSRKVIVSSEDEILAVVAD